MAGTHLFCDCNGIFRAGAQRLSGNRHGAEVPDPDRVLRALCDFVPAVDQRCDSGGYHEETPSVIWTLLEPVEHFKEEKRMKRRVFLGLPVILGILFYIWYIFFKILLFFDFLGFLF